jgi:hypothetical protein
MDLTHTKEYCNHSWLEHSKTLKVILLTIYQLLAGHSEEQIYCFLKKEWDQGTLSQIQIVSLVPVVIVESRHGQVGGHPH